ncbi:MAG: aspartyl protease family protein [Acidobacteriaceae bacterium]|nr:aspartyl protease family protein [Acidobacteriaceae bacterium]
MFDLFRNSTCLILVAAAIACVAVNTAFAETCKIVIAAPSEADKALLNHNYDKAAELYQAELQQNPNDPELTAKMVRVLLGQQKVNDADALVHKALAQNPSSAALLTSEGEVQFREGTPWLVPASINAALKADPCYARTHLLYGRLAWISSLYAVAAREYRTAHVLNPRDPEIRNRWLGSLPVKERIAEVESRLKEEGVQEGERKRLQTSLDAMKKSQDEPNKTCRLVSKTQTAAIHFAYRGDADGLNNYALEVKLNNQQARLQIDTGAGGIVISRSVAERAGLKAFQQIQSGGIGDEGLVGGYIAYADDIKIGPLEFQDCAVQVIDKKNVVDVDGLVGADVFSQFLVTLDFPTHTLKLGPLPPRPGDVAANSLALETGVGQSVSGPHDRYIAPEMKDWSRVYRVGHNLLVPTSLNKSVQKLFILDTGAFATSISPAAAREVTKVRSDDSFTVRGISGKVNKVSSADNITFYYAGIAQQITDVVTFDSPMLRGALGMEISGLIGIGALEQTTMNIDYRDGLVKFTYDANRNVMRDMIH